MRRDYPALVISHQADNLASASFTRRTDADVAANYGALSSLTEPSGQTAAGSDHVAICEEVGTRRCQHRCGQGSWRKCAHNISDYDCTL